MLMLGALPAAAAQRPDPPTNVRVTDFDLDGFTVAWDPVEGDVFYEVQRVRLYAEGSRSTYPPVRVSEGETISFSSGWGATWEVSVRVRTRWAPVMYSEWSDPVTVTIPLPDGYVPPSAPQNLRVAERNEKGETVLIAWDPPAQGTGSFTYTLFIDHPEMSGRFDSTKELSYDAWQLPLNTGYFDVPGLTVTLWVQATDRAGTSSPLSEPLELVCCPF
jgi:hypothetical protein